MSELDNHPTENLAMPWATWRPDRRPQFKIHADLGKAKNAIGQPTGHGVRNAKGEYVYPIVGGVLYQMVEGKWVVRAVVEPRTMKDDHLMFTQPRKWNKQPGITTVITEHPYEK